MKRGSWRAITRQDARQCVDLDKVWTKPLLGHAISRIYHTPDQNGYDHLAPTHQVRFRTEREAQQAGYRPLQRRHAMGKRAGVPARHSRTARAWLPPSQRLRRSLEPEDEQAHGDLHVRLHDEEREQRPGHELVNAPAGGGAGARPGPRLGLLAWPGGHRRPPRGSSGSFQEAGKSGRLAGGAAPCAEARRAAVSQGAPV